MLINALRPTTLALVSAVVAFFVLPDLARAETITASFAMPDGGVTTGLYDGQVRITVSGGGSSNGLAFNDAFYQLPAGGSPVHDGSYYQLTFSTTALQPLMPGQDAYLAIVGGLPAFSADNIYSFVLDTGVFTPSILHFGVSDGNFSDNSGAYTITVAQVPEPASILLVGAGLATAAAFRRRRGWAADRA